MDNSTSTPINNSSSTPNSSSPSTEKKNSSTQSSPIPQNIGGDQKNTTKSNDVEKENKVVTAS